jgi:hypothetical protein
LIAAWIGRSAQQLPFGSAPYRRTSKLSLYGPANSA